MFWVKLQDLRPWMAQQYIFTSDDNNLAKYTYDDFFLLNMYKGDIYKTRNLQNKSMMQLYPNEEELKQAQDSIQSRLDSFEDKLWVPDRNEVIAKSKSKDSKETKAESDEDAAQSESEAKAAVKEEDEKKSSSRSSRSNKKPAKRSKTKETKVKSSNSATRSVRSRK